MNITVDTCKCRRVLVFKRLGSSTSTCFITKAAMHRTWRSKELRCQSNKYQAASEAGELEVFASPRPLSSLLHTFWTRLLRQFEFSKCKNVAITDIIMLWVVINVFVFLEKPRKLWLRACVHNTSGNLILC